MFLCNNVNIRPKKRDNVNRFEEQRANYRWRSLESSSVAQHTNDTEHNIYIEKLDLIKNVYSPRELGTYETVYISYAWIHHCLV